LKFVFHRNHALPRLAWCARIERDQDDVEVHLGPWVETGPDFFFEGAWNSEFSRGGFTEADVCTGSGARSVADGILFASPTDTLERLHVLRDRSGVLVSNSLAFVLAQAGDSCDPSYPFYESDLTSIIRGFHNHTRSIPTRDGNRVHVYYHCNLLVDRRLQVRSEAKPLSPDFGSYQDYAGFLQRAIDGVFRNACDPARKIRYQPMSTISSGYDSPACTVLAHRAGCAEAITFPEARAAFDERDDSGTRIGERLGLKVYEFGSLAYQDATDFPEAEFLAYGTGGEDVVLAPAEKLLVGRVLVTGAIGGIVWDPNHGYNAPDIVRSDPSGASISEFRLRAGFLHAPLPFFGCLRKASIHRISCSPEMAPWSIRQRYNRPIPRRLVEESGVPREWFGQKKKAITQPFHQPLEMTMSPASYVDFKRFMEAYHRRPRRLSLIVHRIGRVIFALNRRVMEYAQWRMKPRWWLLYPVVPRRFRNPLSINLYTFHWGLQKCMQRYSEQERPKIEVELAASSQGTSSVHEPVPISPEL
jgi:hypothetical protein